MINQFTDEKICDSPVLYSLLKYKYNVTLLLISECSYGIILWFPLQVVEKNKESEAVWRSAALQGVLKEVHSLFTMFHGSVRALLEKQPDGGLARSHLYSFIMDYLNGRTSLLLMQVDVSSC